MPSDDRSRLFEAARLRAELTPHDLWLRYLALGGSADAFAIDGFVQGLLPLDSFQQDVLAQALNERLAELYESYHVPLSTPPPEVVGADLLSGIVQELLRRRESAEGVTGEPDRDPS
jgi:hypothetical protein